MMHVTFVRKIPSFPGIFRVETASEVCYTVSEQAPCSLCHPHFSSVDKSYHACDGAYRTLHAARSIEPVGTRRLHWTFSKTRLPPFSFGYSLA